METEIAVVAVAGAIAILSTIVTAVVKRRKSLPPPPPAPATSKRAGSTLFRRMDISDARAEELSRRLDQLSRELHEARTVDAVARESRLSMAADISELKEESTRLRDGQSKVSIALAKFEGSIHSALERANLL